MKGFSTILFFLHFSILLAQTEIRGQIKDSETQEGLPSCLIQIFNSENDSLMGNTLSNNLGFFSIQQPDIPFFISARMISFAPYQSPEYAQDSLPFLTIRLLPDSSLLDEVSLLKKKKLIRLVGDKMIYDVQKSGLADGNSGFEILKRIPGMRTDKDDNLIFRGNGNLQILINGKPSLLGGEALKAFLKSLNGDELLQVELITNPSAKYDAEGTAGIINIKLKKSFKQGISGTIYGGLAYGNFPKNNQGVNLYNQNGKWNFNLGFYHGYSSSVNNREVIQTSNIDTNTLELKQFNDWFPKTRWLTAKSALSYEVKPGFDLGGSLNLSESKAHEETRGLTEEWANGNFDKYTTLLSLEDWKRKTLLSNVYLKHVSDSSRQIIDFQINFANYKKEQEKTTRNNYLNVDDDSPWRNEFAIHNTNPTHFKIISSRLDIEKSFGKTWKMETGLKFSAVQNEYQIRLETEDLNGALELDTNRSDQLTYSEQNMGVYAILKKVWKDWNFQIGLRTEYINFRGESQLRSANEDSYYSFFPSFSINKEIANQQLKLGYSKRIRRPMYMELNPYFNFVDTYNIQIGNPNLQPQYSHNFDFNWVPNDLVSLSIFSNFSNNVMYSILKYNDATKSTTMFQDNIAKSNNVGFSVSKTFELKDYWDLDLYGDFSFNQISSDLEGFSFNEQGQNFYLNLNSIWELPKNWTVNYSAHYSSGGQYGNSRDRESYDMTVSVRKWLLNKKLRISIKARDVLKTNIYRSVTSQDNLITDWSNKWETRIYSLSVSYNFGGGKRKAIKKADLRDEESRL